MRPSKSTLFIILSLFSVSALFACTPVHATASTSTTSAFPITTTSNASSVSSPAITITRPAKSELQSAVHRIETFASYPDYFIHHSTPLTPATPFYTEYQYLYELASKTQTLIDRYDDTAFVNRLEPDTYDTALAAIDDAILGCSYLFGIIRDQNLSASHSPNSSLVASNSSSSSASPSNSRSNSTSAPSSSSSLSSSASPSADAMSTNSTTSASSATSSADASVALASSAESNSHSDNSQSDSSTTSPSPEIPHTGSSSISPVFIILGVVAIVLSLVCAYFYFRPKSYQKLRSKISHALKHHQSKSTSNATRRRATAKHRR